MDIITLKRLKKALFQVQTELEMLGFYDERIQNVDVYLVPFGVAYGWQYYRTTGEIHVPAISFSKLTAVFGHPYTSLRDILRHEYAHAIADTHRALFRHSAFSPAFGAPHDSRIEWDFDPDFHLTPYAATSPCEDFAETFMFYVRHKGEMPQRICNAAIMKKWRFIGRLGRAIRQGKRRWAFKDISLRIG